MRALVLQVLHAPVAETVDVRGDDEGELQQAARTNVVSLLLQAVVHAHERLGVVGRGITVNSQDLGIPLDALADLDEIQLRAADDGQRGLHVVVFVGRVVEIGHGRQVELGGSDDARELAARPVCGHGMLLEVAVVVLVRVVARRIVARRLHRVIGNGFRLVH